jgi:MFS family permease
MTLVGHEQPQHETRRRPATSLWSPFRHRVFALLWVATVLANIGSWMYNASAGWLMTSLAPDPLMVSLVQAAASLPILLFALPAGALADIINPRRFILMLELSVVAVAVVFATIVSADLVTAGTLLLFMFLSSTFFALEAPSWQSIVPQLVPREDLSSAVAANSMGVNISRAIGPALAGIFIAAFGIAAPFWIDSFSNVGVIAVFFWWRSTRGRRSMLPAERFTGAIRTGLRYARNNRHLRATLLRAVGFFLFASAYWALLPLLARSQMNGGPGLYGALLGAIGAGAVSGAVVLPWLRAKVNADALVKWGEVGTALTLLLFGLAHEPLLALSASLIAGVSWMAVIANLNVSAQLSLPDWVRGRGLSMYVTVFFGAMTVGSVIWGELAVVAGLSFTCLAAAAGALLTMPLTARWKLQTGGGIDLRPSMHWPEPIVTGTIENDVGPVLVEVEYRIEPKDRDEFLAALAVLARERRRDGAYAWGVFQDTSEEGRVVETFLLDSWLEHLRQHRRVTNADRVLEEEVMRFVQGKPTIKHLVAVERADERD